MAGHVYLIGSRTFNWYKIGKSNNAAIRVSELGILLPVRIEVLAVWKAENHHETERLLHEKYASHRINGEWFTFTASHIKAIIREMAAAQIEIAENFSNIEKDSHSNVHLMSEPEKPFNAQSGSLSKRFDALIKVNRQLREEIDRLKKEKVA